MHLNFIATRDTTTTTNMASTVREYFSQLTLHLSYDWGEEKNDDDKNPLEVIYESD